MLADSRNRLQSTLPCWPISKGGQKRERMGIYGVYIISKSGGMIFNYDHNLPVIETEKTFSYPLDIKLSMEQKRLTVVFGERDGIKIGHVLLAVNGVPVSGLANL